MCVCMRTFQYLGNCFENLNKIGSGQSQQTFCYGGTLGNEYIRNQQTRREKRKSKDSTHNYVDRVRLAEGPLQDYKHPARGSGWRQNNSISHLDLATSCLNTASVLSHWPLQLSARQHLRHSRSLDYNHHIDHYSDTLDSSEYYWRFEPDTEDAAFEEPVSSLKYVSDRHLSQIKQQQELHKHRNHKCAANNCHPTPHLQKQQLHQQQQQQQQQQLQLQSRREALAQKNCEFSSDACSLRRSRSLAVIREETNNDFQIFSTNHNRQRSQLIPRARLVIRENFQELDPSSEKLLHAANNYSNNILDPDKQSNESIADTCESHQHQLYLIQLQYQSQRQQQQQQQNFHNQYSQRNQHHHNTHLATQQTEDYYDNLKRLDSTAFNLTTDPTCPWHNDKSDLESLNSDYFKNSLHQAHESTTHQPSHLNVVPEKGVANSSSLEKTRLYLSRRQQKQRSISRRIRHNLIPVTGANGIAGDFYPENSQSSVFPETTPSNSDDQSDSASLSEEDYDLKQLEEIFRKTQTEGDEEESSELISLTTTITTRANFETTDDDDNDSDGSHVISVNTIRNANTVTVLKKDADIKEEDTFVQQHITINNDPQHIIAYDAVYLSSEESSDATLIDEDCGNSLKELTTDSCVDEVKSFIYISREGSTIEDSQLDLLQTAIVPSNKASEDSTKTQINIVENINIEINNKETIKETSCQDSAASEIAPIYIQTLKIDNDYAFNKSKISSTSSLSSVIEKRKLNSSSERVTAARPISLTFTAYVNHEDRKCTLKHNQYHSLPDIYIGQSLKVCETIDAHLRSSYYLSKCHSLDESAIERSLHEKRITTTTISFDKNHNATTPSENRIVSTSLYDSITSLIETSHDLEEKIDFESKKTKTDISKNENPTKDFEELKDEKELTCKVDLAEKENHIDDSNTVVENDFETFVDQLTDRSLNMELDTSDFSQQIERRAKEIRESNRGPKSQQIERANRAKFRLENTLTQTFWFSDNQQDNALKPKTTFNKNISNCTKKDDIIEKTQSFNPNACSQTKRKEKTVELSSPLDNFHVCKGSSDDLDTIMFNKENIQKREPLKLKRQQYPAAVLAPYSRKSNNSSSNGGKLYCCSTKAKERCVLKSQLYRAWPIKVLPTLDALSPIKASRMSRPQLRQAIDISNKRKRQRDGAADRNSSNQEKDTEYAKKVDSMRFYWSNLVQNTQQQQQQQQQYEIQKPLKEKRQNTTNEFKDLESKITEKEQTKLTEKAVQHEDTEIECEPTQNQKDETNTTTNDNNKQRESNNFIPSIEIIELDDDKKATIVRVAPLNNGVSKQPPFDHIRYRVLKSHQLFRKKETAFHDILQYLQEYSLKELFSNNNVVIVEPVRTKIELPIQQTILKRNGNMSSLTTDMSFISSKTQSTRTTANNGSHLNTSCTTTNGIKRRFFYQPVQVNRELYDEELPNPDTVRNVRKYFEEHFMAASHRNKDNINGADKHNSEQGTVIILSPKSRRAASSRYFTIDTTYDDADLIKSNYDKSLSLKRKNSSRVVDEKMSQLNINKSQPPKPKTDCNKITQLSGQLIDDKMKGFPTRNSYKSFRTTCDPTKNVSFSHTNDYNTVKIPFNYQREDDITSDFSFNDLYDNNNEIHETLGTSSYFVSNDVLKKIRDCGSTVTYYGGRVIKGNTTMDQLLHKLDKDYNTKDVSSSIDVNTELHPNHIHKCNKENDKKLKKLSNNVIFNSKHEAAPHADGIRFTLVKSNSCSSHLELAGSEDATETEFVRKIIQMFETQTLPKKDTLQLTCKKEIPPEKEINLIHELSKSPSFNVTADNLSKLNFSRCKQKLEPVCYQAPDAELKNSYATDLSGCVKVMRNKNVDLAFNSIKPPTKVCKQNSNRKYRDVKSAREETCTNSINNAIKQTINDINKTLMEDPNRCKAPVGPTNKISTTIFKENVSQKYALACDDNQYKQMQTQSSSIHPSKDIVVKYYVTNDRSLYENRKYDEIEFEEFQIFDPTKDFGIQTQKKQQQQQQVNLVTNSNEQHQNNCNNNDNNNNNQIENAKFAFKRNHLQQSGQPVNHCNNVCAKENNSVDYLIDSLEGKL